MAIFLAFLTVSCLYMSLFFSRKILVLLLLECMFLASFLIYYTFFFLGGLSLIFPLLILTIFFVLDSVMGVTLLVSLGRSQSPHSSLFG